MPQVPTTLKTCSPATVSEFVLCAMMHHTMRRQVLRKMVVSRRMRAPASRSLISQNTFVFYSYPGQRWHVSNEGVIGGYVNSSGIGACKWSVRVYSKNTEKAHAAIARADAPTRDAARSRRALLGRTDGVTHEYTHSTCG